MAMEFEVLLVRGLGVYDTMWRITILLDVALHVGKRIHASYFGAI